MKPFNKINAFVSIICLLLVSNPVFAQSNRFVDAAIRKQQFHAEIDSLENHPNKIKLWHWLSPYRRYDKAEMQKYCTHLTSAFELRKDSLNKWQQMTWLYEIASIQMNFDSLRLAKNTFEEGLKLADKNIDTNPYLYLKWGIAFIYRQQNKWQESNTILAELRDLAKSKNFKAEETSYKYWMAENHQNLGEYEQALVLANELYQLSIKNGDLINACYDLVQLGQISYYMEKDTSHLEYFHMAIELGEKTASKNIRGINLIEAGDAYIKIDKPLKALQYYQKADLFFENLLPREKIRFHNGYCSVYLALDNVQRAQNYAIAAQKEAKKVDGELWISIVNYNLARCFMQSAQYDSAKVYLTKTLTLNKKFRNEKKLSEIYQSLSDVSFKLNDYDQALAYLDSSHSIDNARIKNYNANLLAKLRTETDYFIQKAKITELATNNKINKEKTIRLKNSILAIASLLFLSLVFFLVSRRQVLRLKESHLHLVKKNIELDQLNKRYYECENKSNQKIKEIKNEEYLVKQLHQLLIEQESFTDPNLSLTKLAKALRTNTSYLSTIINKKYDCNFKTLLNKLRISKAKKILTSKDYAHYSMDGIAVEAGFKSRSAFYSSFKAYTGLTPTQYSENFNLVELV